MKVDWRKWGAVWWLGAVLSATAGAGELPFEFDYSGGVPILSLTLNGGGPVLFLMDTGSGVSVIDPEVFRRAGGTEGKMGGIKGISGRTRYSATGSLTISAAGRNWPAHSFLVQSVPPSLRSAFGVEGGWVGWPLFQDGVVELDYEARRLRWHDADLFEPPLGAVTLSLVTSSPFQRPKREGVSDPIRLMAEARVNGVSGRFLLDTASNGMVTLTPEMLKKTGLIGQEPYTSGSVVGSDGGVVEKRFYLGATLEIGGEWVEPLVAGSNPASVLGEDGLVGWGALHAFHWWIDAQRGVVYARRRPDFDCTRTPLAWLYEGEYHRQRGDWDGAIRAWRRTLAVNPRDLVQRYRLIEALIGMKRIKEARAEVEVLVGAHPENPSVLEAAAGYRSRLDRLK